MIYTGDCIEVMVGMDAESVDAIVTDPPYGLEFMGKEWDRFRIDDPGTTRNRGERAAGGRIVKDSSAEPRAVDNPWQKEASGYRGGERPTTSRCTGCGKRDQWRNPHDCVEGAQWKSLLIDPHAAPPSSLAYSEWTRQWALSAYRVAKPSAYLLAFGGTRTFHRLACAIEDAGWIIRDTLVWGYASGFPKSKASLKPAWEPIVMARKPGPLRDLDIDGCRMVGGPTAIMEPWENDANLCASCAADADYPERSGAPATRASTTPRLAAPQPSEPATSGATDRTDTGCSDGTTAASTATSSSIARSGRTRTGRSKRAGSSTISMGIVETIGSRTCPSCGSISTPTTTIDGTTSIPSELPAGTTSADIALGRWPPNVLWTDDIVGYPGVIGGGPETSRVFLIPKADRADREPVLGGLPLQDDDRDGSFGLDAARPHTSPDYVYERKPRRNVHPTVKPTDLMRHLVRLVTPAGGVVLDPFLGSGTTAIAAEMEGFGWIGIEREAEYVAIAEARLNGTQRGLGLDVTRERQR